MDSVSATQATGGKTVSSVVAQTALVAVTCQVGNVNVVVQASRDFLAAQRANIQTARLVVKCLLTSA